MRTIPTARSPRALVLSASLHALVLGGALVWMWWLQRARPEEPQIFELVAGEGQDYMATEAPTTAAPPMPTVKVDLPDPEPIITPAPQPEPQRTPPPPKIEPAPVPKAEPKQTPPPPKKVEKAAPKEQPPPPKKQEPAPAPRMSIEDFRKQHGAPKVATPKAAPKVTPKTINADSIAGRVASGSTNEVKEGAGGQAMAQLEADMWARYQALLIQRIRRSMEAAGVTDLRSARVQFSISAAGTVSGARITSSSGSAEFDAAVLAALRSLGQLGPPPTGRAETVSAVINLRERG